MNCKLQHILYVFPVWTGFLHTVSTKRKRPSGWMIFETDIISRSAAQLINTSWSKTQLANAVVDVCSRCSKWNIMTAASLEILIIKYKFPLNYSEWIWGKLKRHASFYISHIWFDRFALGALSFKRVLRSLETITEWENKDILSI